MSPYGDAAGGVGKEGDFAVRCLLAVHTPYTHMHTDTHTNVIYTLSIINIYIYSLLQVENLFSPQDGFKIQLFFLIKRSEVLKKETKF